MIPDTIEIHYDQVGDRYRLVIPNFGLVGSYATAEDARRAVERSGFKVRQTTTQPIPERQPAEARARIP